MNQPPAHVLRGQQTRESLMGHAVGIATREGLEALTIGRVADISGLAKATVLGHYGSKEQLQLATLEAGSQRFIAAVVAPAGVAPDGLPRLQALIDRWLDHISDTAGGCLFASVAAEFDGRPGPVRERVQKLVQMWLAALTAEATRAKQLKQLAPSADPEQLVFCLYGVELALNVSQQLLDDRKALARARATMHQLLRDAASPAGKRLLRAPGRGR